MIFELAQDFHDAVEAMPRGHPRHRMLELLEEAIRRDIHFIARHPSTLFQCMWNTCWWYDCPEAAKHYEEPEDGWKDPPPWVRPGPKVHPLLEVWRIDKGKAVTGFRWIRSLRPPLSSLGGPQKMMVRAHGAVRSVSVCSDGKRVAIGSLGSSVCVWEAESGMNIVCGDTFPTVNAVAFSPDGQRIAAACGGGWALNGIRLYDARTGEELERLDGHRSDVNCVSWSHDGKRIVSGSGGPVGEEDNTVRVWDGNNGAELLVLRGHTGGIHSVAFSPDGLRVATSAREKWTNESNVWIWDAQTGDRLFRLRRVGEGVAFVPNQQGMLCVCDSFAAVVCNTETGAKAVRLHGHRSLVTCVSCSPDGAMIVTGSHDKTVRVWNSASGKQLLCLRGHEGNVTSVAFFPDSRHIASGSEDGWVRVWDTEVHSMQVQPKDHGDSVCDIVFASDGERLASASSDCTIRVWDATEGTEQLCLRGVKSGARCAAFSIGGSLIAGGSCDRSVCIWDARTGARLRRLFGHTRSVTAVAFSPDSQCLATGSEDKTIRIWDINSGAQQFCLRGHTDVIEAVVFSEDGGELTSFGGLRDGSVRVWNLRSGQCVRAQQREIATRAAEVHLAGPRCQVHVRGQHRGQETTVEVRGAGEAIAWFPEILGYMGAVASHPRQAIWAAVAQIHLYMLCLEGEETL